MIEGIHAVEGIAASLGAVGAGGVNGAQDFSQWLASHVEQVNQHLVAADTQVRQLAVGEATNLHQVMLTLEQAKLQFELLLQVRNKVLEAYQDIMRMQI
jgi:flagellar hook-basal body complex protein FliE